MTDGIVHFSGGEYATLAELKSAGEAVSALSPVISIFPVGDRVVQSDGRAQRVAAPLAKAQLDALEARKDEFMPGVLAGRGA